MKFLKYVMVTLLVILAVVVSMPVLLVFAALF